MRVTIVGVIWTIMLIYALSRKKYDLSVFMLFLSSVLQCDSILFFGDAEGVGVFLFTCIVIDFKVFIDIIRNKKKWHFDKIIPFIFVLFVSILLSILLNHISFSFSVLLKLAPLIIFFVTYICLLQIMDSIIIDSFEHMIIKVIYFVVIIGLLQYLIAIRMLPNLGVLKTFIYNEVTVKSSMYFANPTNVRAIRVYSSFMEPSYCAAFLTASVIFVFEKRKKIPYAYFLIILCLFEILLSKSSTAYGCCLLCIMIYIVVKRRKIPINFVYASVAMLLLFTLFIVSGLIDLNNIIFRKSETGSGAYRDWLNHRAYDLFLLSPWWGNGYKAYRASSIIHSLLSEMGIIGLVSYFLMNIAILRRFFKERELGLAYMIWLISTIIAQILSCPDIDFCVYWFSLYVSLGFELCSRTTAEALDE